jgi:hypothetical protein
MRCVMPVGTAGQLRNHGELATYGGGGAVVIGVEVNAGELTVVRGDKGGTGTGERIEDGVVLQMEYCARY